jgi:hypothetical protein
MRWLWQWYSSHVLCVCGDGCFLNMCAAFCAMLMLCLLCCGACRGDGPLFTIPVRMDIRKWPSTFSSMEQIRISRTM